MPTLSELENDNDFLSLNGDEKNFVLGKMFPDFLELDEDEQDFVVSKFPTSPLAGVQDQLQAIPRVEEQAPSQFGTQDLPDTRLEQPDPAAALTSLPKIATNVLSGAIEFPIAGAEALMGEIVAGGGEFGDTFTAILENPTIRKALPHFDLDTPEGKKSEEFVNDAFHAIFKLPAETVAEQIPEDFPNTRALVASTIEALTVFAIPLKKANTSLRQKLKGAEMTKQVLEGMDNGIVEILQKAKDITPEELAFVKKKLDGKLKDAKELIDSNFKTPKKITPEDANISLEITPKKPSVFELDNLETKHREGALLEKAEIETLKKHRPEALETPKIDVGLAADRPKSLRETLTFTNAGDILREEFFKRPKGDGGGKPPPPPSAPPVPIIEPTIAKTKAVGKDTPKEKIAESIKVQEEVSTPIRETHKKKIEPKPAPTKELSKERGREFDFDKNEEIKISKRKKLVKREVTKEKVKDTFSASNVASLFNKFKKDPELVKGIALLVDPKKKNVDKRIGKLKAEIAGGILKKKDGTKKPLRGAYNKLSPEKQREVTAQIKQLIADRLGIKENIENIPPEALNLTKEQRISAKKKSAAERAIEKEQFETVDSELKSIGKKLSKGFEDIKKLANDFTQDDLVGNIKTIGKESKPLTKKQREILDRAIKSDYEIAVDERFNLLHKAREEGFLKGGIKFDPKNFEEFSRAEGFTDKQIGRFGNYLKNFDEAVKAGFKENDLHSITNEVNQKLLNIVPDKKLHAKIEAFIKRGLESGDIKLSDVLKGESFAKTKVTPAKLTLETLSGIPLGTKYKSIKFRREVEITGKFPNRMEVRDAKGRELNLSVDEALVDIPKGTNVGGTELFAGIPIHRILTDKQQAAFKEFFQPLSTVPESAKLMLARLRQFGDIETAERVVQKISERLKPFSPENQKEIFMFLDGRLDILDLAPEVRGVANQIRFRHRQIGKMLVRRGLIDQKTFEANPYYVHYMFAKHIVGDGQIALNPSGKLNLSETMRRNPNLTLEQRQALGLIEDASIAVPVGMGKALTDIAKFDYMKKIADNPEWTWSESVIKIEGEGTFGIGKLAEEVKIAAEVVLSQPKNARARARYTKLNKALADAVKKTENIPEDFEQLPVSKAYGELSGAFVRKEISKDIRPIFDSIRDAGRGYGAVISAIEQGTTLFKIAKVPLNIPTATRNVISNIIQNNMRGRNLTQIPNDMRLAAKSMKNKDKFFIEARRNGLFRTNFSIAEINEVFAAVNRINPSNWNTFIEFAQKAASYYGKIDDFFKLTIFHQLRRSGVSVDTALLEAQKWGMDYSLAARSIKGARRTVAPFITYQYKIAPLIYESLKKRPWVIGKFLAIPSVLAPMVAKDMLGISEKQWEKLKKNLPFYIKKNKTHAVMPWKSPDGDYQWMNMEYFFPWGTWHSIYKDLKDQDFAELAKDSGVLSNPFLDIVVALKSAGLGIPPKDPFTRKPIYSNLDTPSEQYLKTAEFLWNKWGPSMLSRNGALGYTTSIGDKDKWGRTISPEQALGRWFGFNIIAISERQTNVIKKARIKSLNKELFRVLNDPQASDSKKQSAQKIHQKKVRDVIEGN